MSMSRFLALWTHPNFSPAQVSSADFETVERELQSGLPSDYKDAMLEFGLPRPTIELLNAICDRELDLHPVSDFFDPEEIIDVTTDWRDLGLPEELVAFATDGMGNLFCFHSDPNESGLRPVFLWDHDTKAAHTVALSFSSWIEGFCHLASN